MQLYGIGIDVVEVDRIKSSIDQFGEQFLSRIFTPLEREYCERQKQQELNFAARFAAKEAIAKALGTGIGKSVSWQDMEIIRKESGEPDVKLTGKAEALAEEINLAQIKVSLTHAKHYAAANAVVMVK